MSDAATRGPGRPAAATRDDVLNAAMQRFLRGRRIDVQAIAAELGLGRTTIYRWFGSRDDLIGAVMLLAADPLLADAAARARGSGGVRLLATFDRFNRSLASAPALRQFIEQERDAALRVLASGVGIVRAAMVERIKALIDAEVDAGAYDPPADTETLAYAIVRLAEAFLYNDTVAGMRGDVDRLRDVEAALLGVRS